jgi:hypothetical protein
MDPSYVPASGILLYDDDERKTHRMDGASAPCNTQIAAFKAADLTDIATYSCHGGIHIDVKVWD